jgi:hypothetical protein
MGAGRYRRRSGPTTAIGLTGALSRITTSVVIAWARRVPALPLTRCRRTVAASRPVPARAATSTGDRAHPAEGRRAGASAGARQLRNVVRTQVGRDRAREGTAADLRGSGSPPAPAAPPGSPICASPSRPPSLPTSLASPSTMRRAGPSSLVASGLATRRALPAMLTLRVPRPRAGIASV